MKTNDIRRVIDASLGSFKLSPEQREDLLNRAVASENEPAPPHRKTAKWLLAATLIIFLMAALLAPAVSGTARREEIIDEGDYITYTLDRGEDVTIFQMGEHIPSDGNSIWGAEFLTLLRLYGAQLLLPKWCPEDYAPRETRINHDAHRIDVYLSNGDERDIELSVTVLDDTFLAMTTLVESIEGTAETWTYEGIDYHYSENYLNSSVLWFEGNCEAYLSGPRDRSLFLKMIESICE